MSRRSTDQLLRDAVRLGREVRRQRRRRDRELEGVRGFDDRLERLRAHRRKIRAYADEAQAILDEVVRRG